MNTNQRSTPSSSDTHESLAEQLRSMLREPSLELAPATQGQHLDTGASGDKEKKAVNFRPSKTSQSLVSMVYAKQFAMSKRSILSTATPNTPGSIYKRKTLLDQPMPNEMELKAWKHTDEFTKLAAAAAPLYEMAKSRSWELKTFTLILNKNLSDRLDNGDNTALEYIRDQMTRLIRETVDPRAEFLYGVEKTPEALADKSSRRRWHLHGAMIGPAGFEATGKTALRMKLQSLKGEADADLRFDTPGANIKRDQRASVLGWCFYSVKNGLSVEMKPSLEDEYELPPGKHTFISSQLRREAKRWHSATPSIIG
ncbi:hypothetical protein V2J87_25200 [Pseudomonas alliivorans]|nr:hypothetical protein [Pseudomonas alliivorans]